VMRRIAFRCEISFSSAVMCLSGRALLAPALDLTDVRRTHRGIGQAAGVDLDIEAMGLGEQIFRGVAETFLMGGSALMAVFYFGVAKEIFLLNNSKRGKVVLYLLGAQALLCHRRFLWLLWYRHDL
jgi:hypothetical protein